MEAVEERQVLHLHGEGGEEVAGAYQHLHIGLDVADEDERCQRRDFLPAPAEATRFHVVFQQVDGLRVRQTDEPRHLVEGHGVPKPHQAYPSSPNVGDEEAGHGHLAAGDQDGVRRHLPVYVALARPARAELHEIVVVLHQGDEADEI